MIFKQLKPIQLKPMKFGRTLSFFLLGVMGFSVTAVMAAEKIKREIVITEGTQLHFYNLRGEVEFKGWDESRLTVEGELDEESTGLLIEESEGKVLIKVKLPRQLSPKKGSKLVVRLPQFVVLNAQGVSTNWTLSNVGLTSIHSVSGKINLNKSSSDVTLDVVSAAVFARSIKGDLGVTSLSGKIDVSEIEGKVTLSTVEGELHFTQPIIHQARLSSINGKIYVDGLLAEKGNLVVNSVDGDVFLKVGASESLNCELSALHGGEIKNHLKLTGEESKSFAGKHLSLMIGEGGAGLEATTISGTIHLQD